MIFNNNKDFQKCVNFLTITQNVYNFNGTKFDKSTFNFSLDITEMMTISEDPAQSKIKDNNDCNNFINLCFDFNF